MAIVIILLMFIDLSFGSIYWELVTKPSGFGGELKLKCHLDKSTSLARTRQWCKGNDSNILVMNGKALDSNKFSESLDQTKRISVLTISSLEPSDINVQYACQHGFFTYKNWLNMSLPPFENQPTQQNLEKDQTLGNFGRIVFTLVSIGYIILALSIFRPVEHP